MFHETFGMASSKVLVKSTLSWLNADGVESTYSNKYSQRACSINMDVNDFLKAPVNDPICWYGIIWISLLFAYMITSET